MKFGFVFPKSIIDIAIESGIAAEKAGWNGFFLWEPIFGMDPWVTLGAISVYTERIKLGTFITPVSRCRPWKIASEVVTLDHVSKGRAILSVALGALDTGFAEFGEVIDRKERAKLLDEGLEIISSFWNGPPFIYNGEHYKIEETNFFKRHPPPLPIQEPRIPIWVVGAWPRKKSINRALCYDGIIAAKMTEKGEFESVTPEDVKEISFFIKKNRTKTTPFDIIIEAEATGINSQESKNDVLEYEKAGATWWIESMWSEKKKEKVLNRIQTGPPI